MTKHEFETIIRIIARADDMHITIGTHTTKLLDMQNAHKQFSLRLDELLAAPALDFAHDIIGIQSHMNRITCKVENLFVPRYAEQ